MTEPLHSSAAPLVGVVMGSDSDWRVMSDASQALTDFGIPHEVEVVSAHRTPDKLMSYAREARSRGLRVIIAGAGGAAHLPGMLASMTALPVIGVPVPLAYLDGMDSLLSIVQMPAGIPVATVSIGGARNAGLLAARILGAADDELADRVEAYAADLEAQVEEKNERLKGSLGPLRPRARHAVRSSRRGRCGTRTRPLRDSCRNVPGGSSPSTSSSRAPRRCSRAIAAWAGSDSASR